MQSEEYLNQYPSREMLLDCISTSIFSNFYKSLMKHPNSGQERTDIIKYIFIQVLLEIKAQNHISLKRIGMM